MEETILSAGIDIGTSTTQLVFSKLTIKTIAGFGMIPRAEVVDKEVIYRSAIHFTPLSPQDEINGEAVAEIIRNEYTAAGRRPEEISTGAVIITGETARKRNAAAVTAAMAELAGNFVVASAGPDFESLLAGRGAMADKASEETGIPTINLDIGGGTTNLCLFQNGKPVSTGCYDIGGRLIRLDSENRITYIASKLNALLHALGISLSAGDILPEETGKIIAAAMADILAESVGLASPTPLGNSFITNHGLSLSRPAKQLAFSGGVADCMKDNYSAPFEYGDLGVLLGHAIRTHPLLSSVSIVSAGETLRATVIGAGTCSMEVSGSTIAYQGCSFPLKNLPVIKIECPDEQAVPHMTAQLQRGLALLREGGEILCSVAVAMDGPPCPSFACVEEMAQRLKEFFGSITMERQLIPVVVEHDFGKALGQAMRRRLGRDASLLCIDGISCRYGDYIDIGAPLSGGKAVPVVVKTLIFSQNQENAYALENNTEPKSL